MEALDFRRAMRKVDEEYGDSWWFKVWGPEHLAEEGIGDREDWMIRAEDKWHGFGNLAPGFNMLRQRAWSPGLLLYALTGWGDPGDRDRTRDAGFDRHFVKPVSIDELLTRLADDLERRDSRGGSERAA